MKRVGWVVLGAALIWSASGCDDDATKPLAGAGIRFVFPSGADTLEGLRVALLDPDQTYPLCGEAHGMTGTSTRPQTLGPCDSTRLIVRDILGNEIRRFACPTPPETTCNVNDLVWDGTNSEGDTVSGGYYSYQLSCFQADSVQEVGKGIYVPRGPEDVCDWPLWSEEVSALSPSRTLEFAPFPLQLDLGVSGADSIDVIRIRNPYAVRVHADGMQTFEQQITLVEGKYTDVAVTFTPLETP